MSRTYCVAKMKFVDVTALADSNVTTSDNKTIGNTDLFKTNTDQKPYGTLELNKFVLDETREIITENPTDIAFMSNLKSGEAGYFSNNPAIEVVFTEPHSSAGLTLYFADEYPEEIKVTWYSIYGSKIIEEEFHPDSLLYVCRKQVKSYGKIRIEFVRTLWPERYIKLQYILYGVAITWDADMVKSAVVQEEIDLTSETLSINTADISIVDVENDFDIANEDGAWKSIQRTQEVTLTEVKDGVEIPAGTFFVDTSSFKGNVASFSLIDRIGIMEKYTFYDGEIYSGVKAGIILEKIFASAGITKYLISDDVYNIELYGYLAIQKCRSALQMICFACGAIADDSRSDTIKVYKPDRYVKHTVGINRKFNGYSKISLDDFISGVSIECNKYKLETDTSEIYNDVLEAGDNKINFTEPYLPSSVTVSSGTIKEVKTNYIIVTMEAAGNCVITGIKYAVSTFKYEKNLPYMESGELENVKYFGVITLYNPELLAENAQYLLDYYSLRKKVDMKYLLEQERVGNWVNVQDRSNKISTTIIESQTLDLAGGYIATASCRGYSVVITEDYFTGTELYSGGDILL